jgi:ABC-type Fe3+/spermidine/putrescine transport system ATPase subunit
LLPPHSYTRGVLDVSLRDVSFANVLREVTLTFPASRHTAITGPPASGASTLLRILAGTLRPDRGAVVIGTRDVTDVKASRRPLLHVTSDIDVPRRWSVQHALVAAVRTRTLDREDRHREYALAVDKWQLESLLERRIDALSSTEIARVHFARIELLHPAIVVADRWLERVNASARDTLADALYRTMRVIGATVITAPSTRDELALSDHIVVLDAGRVVQSGSAADVFAHPESDAAAIATGEVDLIPITIAGTVVESVIGAWDVTDSPFQGSGVALVRPSDFTLAAPGEDSDLIFGVEEAGFAGGRWIARGMLSGGVTLRVELPRDANVHKGRLLALRYDPARFRLLPRELAPLRASVPTDVVPPLRETR